MKIATICIGYADGLNRLLSCSGTVSIHQQPATIIGSICMDQTMVDVSDIPNVTEGDEVILWGTSICDLNNIAKKSILFPMNYFVI